MCISPSHAYDQLSETIPTEAWQRQLKFADLSVAGFNVERARKQANLDFTEVREMISQNYTSSPQEAQFSLFFRANSSRYFLLGYIFSIIP